MSHEERIEALEKKLAAVKAQLNRVCAHDSVVEVSIDDCWDGNVASLLIPVVEYRCQDCGIVQRSPFGSAFRKAITQ